MVPWSPWTVLLVYALQFLFVGVLGVAVAGVVADPGLRSVLLLPATSVATAVFTWFVVQARHPGAVRRLFGTRPPRPADVLRGLGMGVLAYLLINVGVGTALQLLITASGGEVPVVQESFRDFAADPTAAPVFLVGAVLLAPIGEELLFRGLLFASLAARFGRRVGMAISGGVFGAVHLDPSVSVEGNLLVFALIATLGVFLAWSYDRARTIVAPMAVHSAFNAISATLLLTVGT